MACVAEMQKAIGTSTSDENTPTDNEQEYVIRSTIVGCDPEIFSATDPLTS